MLRFVISFFAAITLAACASNPTELQILNFEHMNQDKESEIDFLGLEFLADPIPGRLKNRVNIFYLHGIGWTENPEKDQLGDNLLRGIAKAYKLPIEGNIIKSSCGSDAKTQATARNYTHITSGEKPTYYETIIPGVKLKLDKMVCMDKQTLEVDDTLEYVVYRIFWDELFWNSFQFAHVGQDDAQGSSASFAQLREKYNRKLKDELVNYGFSDAVMYLGPAGKEIRRAIKGAMCSAALDAAGVDFVRQGQSISAAKACQVATNTTTEANQFAFVTESLGSKITFDVMRDTLTDGRETILDEMISGSEIYMLANQIALLSLSDLTLEPKKRASNDPEKSRPKIVALSEVNDFLTYEITPFLEQLWKRQSVPEGQPKPVFNDEARDKVSDALGFDFVDMRLRFADPVVPVFKALVDPLQAHSDHSEEPELIMMMLCGARNGRLHDENCLATSEWED